MAWSQIGDQVERNSDQGRMTALTFVAGDMLYRGTAGLAGELGKAALMQAMSAGGIDADRANMVQTLDQPQHRGRLCRFRYLAQPDEPALTAFRAALGQSIEPAPLLGQQPAGHSQSHAVTASWPTRWQGPCQRAEGGAGPVVLQHDAGGFAQRSGSRRCTLVEHRSARRQMRSAPPAVAH